MKIRINSFTSSIMKLELFKEPVCIWQMSTDEILGLAGLLNRDGSYTNLGWKNILDFWAWLSDLSSRLVEGTSVGEMVAFDKIYAEESILSKVTQETLSYLRKIQKLFNDTEWAQAENDIINMEYIIRSISERIRVVLSFKETTFKNDRIKKHSSFEEISDYSFDYIFINFLFSYVKEKDILLCELYSKLRKWGKIIITDIIGTPGMKDFINSSLFQPDMEMRPFQKWNSIKGVITVRKQFRI